MTKVDCKFCAVLHYREKDAGSILRLPARIIESLVENQLLLLWTNTNQLLSLLRELSLSASQQTNSANRALTLCQEWGSFSPQQKITYIKRIFLKVRISCHTVELHISPIGMLACLNGKPLTESIIDKRNAKEILTIPVEFKRCGIETRLIITDNSVRETPHEITVKALQEAISKALGWHEGLLCGTYSSTRDIAKREGTTQRYIASIMKLAFLAPDIIDVIIQGNLPVTCTLTRLRKGFPLEWEQQRRALGFPQAYVP